MKKLIKKAGTLFLTLCAAVSCFALSARAADGVLQFSDPKGKAGDEIEVRVKVISNSGPIGSFEIKVEYDTSLLQFKSGVGAEASGDNMITISSVTDGTKNVTLQTIKFLALDEGTAKIDVVSCEATLTSGENLALSKGNSRIVIKGGTPVPPPELPPGQTVDVGGVSYTVDSGFKEKDIPMGFVAVETELYGSPVRAMVLENGDQYMYYLKDGEGKSDYFMYNAEDSSFTMTEPVLATNQLTLFLMDYQPDFELPERFWTTTMTINEKEFSIWNNMDNQDYYLVYAMNNSGERGFYQYDSVESTYQRVNMAELKAEEKEPVSEEPADSKLTAFLKKNMKPILIAITALIFLLLVIIIILAGKLSRKADYEQYESNYYDAAEKEAGKEKKQKKHKKRKAEEEYEEDYPPDLDEYDEYDGYEEDSGGDDGDYSPQYDDPEYDDSEYDDSEYDGSDDDLREEDGYYDEEDYEAADEDFDYEEDGLDSGETQDAPAGPTRNDKFDSDDFPIDFIEL